MALLTRLPVKPWGWAPAARRSSGPPAPIDMDPRVATVARAARAVDPEMRIGMVSEILRMSPYRAIAVVEGERLIGMASESQVLGALLGAVDAEERARVRELPIRAVMSTPSVVVTPSMRVSEVAVLFEEATADALPVIDSYRIYLGMIARSDLVQDLIRPFRPPTVGGMATPLGVYLTTGAVSGGAGTIALALTGFFMFLVHLLAMGVGFSGQYWLFHTLDSTMTGLPLTVRTSFGNVIPYLLQFALFLVLLRLSPVAGYHAAEHQVVHALERAEPLLVDNVRRMPRVHPRCGTNLVAGVLILSVGSQALTPFIGDAYSLVLSFLVAFAYWRTVGGWLQQHLTTRPATDAQIESGIRAARELLEEHSRAPYAAVRPSGRLWRMGFLQILCGFATGYALLELVLALSAPLRTLVQPWIGDIMPF